MKVEGTQYEVMLSSSGYHVMRRTQRVTVAGGAPVVVSVAGPYETRVEAVDEAKRIAAMRGL